MDLAFLVLELLFFGSGSRFCFRLGSIFLAAFSYFSTFLGPIFGPVFGPRFRYPNLVPY